MLYDCVLVNDEISLLALRMELLNPVVDKFVVVEATKTFWGDPKPLHFEDSRAQFDPWKEKIIHHVVTDMPVGDDPRERETHQRMAFKKALPKVEDGAMVLLADVDEFPNPKILQQLTQTGPLPPRGILSLQLFNHIGYLNLRRRDFVYRTKLVWSEHWNFFNAHYLRWSEQAVVVPEAGWHFGYLGGIKQIEKKILSGSHRWDNKTWESTLRNYEAKGIPHMEGHACLALPFVEPLFPAELVRHTADLQAKGWLI